MTTVHPVWKMLGLPLCWLGATVVVWTVYFTARSMNPVVSLFVVPVVFVLFGPLTFIAGLVAWSVGRDRTAPVRDGALFVGVTSPVLLWVWKLPAIGGVQAVAQAGAAVALILAIRRVEGRGQVLAQTRASSNFVRGSLKPSHGSSPQ